MTTQDTTHSKEILQRLKTDFPYFAVSCLRIVNKKGKLVPLLLNKAQKRLHKVIRKIENDNKPLRLIVCKARQLGVSTFIQAYLFWKVWRDEHKQAVTVADEMGDARGLLNKCQLFLDYIPDFLRPETKYRTKNEIYFRVLDSSLGIDTANNESLGRSKTYQYVHISEAAFFGGKGEKAILGLRQTIAFEPDTAIVIESTSNGMDNWYYEEVRRALENESEYGTCFLPWYLAAEYNRPGKKLTDLDDEEKKLVSELKLKHSQLRWRRYTIENNTQGSIDLFKQEYPSTLEESFLYTGHPVFPLVNLTKCRMSTPPPVLQGVVDIVRQVVMPQEKGPFKIWQVPEPKRAYTIGVDVAEGIQNKTLDRDFSVIQVVDALTLEQVAEFRERVPTDVFAHIVKLVAQYFNNGYVTVERNGPGLAVLNKLRDLRYRRIYKERQHSQIDDARTETMGLRIKGNNKPMVINNFVELFRDGHLQINSPILLDEMSKFSVNKKGRMKATIGHDDTVMAFAIALWGMRYQPLQSAIKAALPSPPIKRMTYAQAVLMTEDDDSTSKWLADNFSAYKDQ